jgi:hypothetical protein
MFSNPFSVIHTLSGTAGCSEVMGSAAITIQRIIDTLNVDILNIDKGKSLTRSGVAIDRLAYSNKCNAFGSVLACANTDPALEYDYWHEHRSNFLGPQR